MKGIKEIVCVYLSCLKRYVISSLRRAEEVIDFMDSLKEQDGGC